MDEPLSVEQAVSLPRIAIESIMPAVEQGAYAAKALQGRPLTLSTVLICDGHGKLAGEIIWRRSADADTWQRVPLEYQGNDLWQAELTPRQTGKVYFAVEAWVDAWASYSDELNKKIGRAHVSTPVT